jgi:hypothetical protein
VVEALGPLGVVFGPGQHSGALLTQLAQVTTLGQLHQPELLRRISRGAVAMALACCSDNSPLAIASSAAGNADDTPLSST